jgi:hypothetical protein
MPLHELAHVPSEKQSFPGVVDALNTFPITNPPEPGRSTVVLFAGLRGMRNGKLKPFKEMFSVCSDSN